MEAFEIHLITVDKWGKKRPFVSKKISAATGWEAMELAREFVYRRMKDVESVEFDYWTVLNPYEFHFDDQSVFANQKREK